MQGYVPSGPRSTRTSPEETEITFDNTDRDSMEGSIEEQINAILSSSGSAVRDKPTFDELYGDQMGRIEQSVAEQTGNTQNALMRATMAGGGDISGSGGARINEADQTANETIADSKVQFQNRYNDFVENMRRFDLQRKDNLDATALSFMRGERDVVRDDDMFDRNLKLQKDLAKKQRNVELISAGLDFVGNFIPSF